MSRLTPLTAAELARRAESVSEVERPEPARGQVTYRCGHVIYTRRGEWRTACRDRTPGPGCLCNASTVPQTTTQEVAA